MTKKIPDDINKLERLLKKNDLTNHQSPEFKQFSRNSKRQIYRNVLKRTAKYSIPYAVFMYVYFTCKNNVVMIVTVKAVTAASVALLIGAGGYFFADKYFSENRAGEAKEIKQIENAGPEDDGKSGIEAVNANVTENKKNADEESGLEVFNPPVIAIVRFASKTVDRKDVDSINTLFLNSLSDSTNKYVSFVSMEKASKSPYAVHGSIEKLGSTFFFSVKVIDTKTTRVVFISSKECDSVESVKSYAGELAKQVKEKIE
ncbi:MAG: hypothetical protein JW982_08385 [Spirochaetes bacterium]|nr:hypothetical protein [Spirochaetota bacterium]